MISGTTLGNGPGRRGVSPPTGLLMCGLVISFGAGCGSPPRGDLDALRAIGDASGLPGAIEYLAVGPEGGPLDEPDGPGPTLTLSEALRRAMTTDPGLQAALAGVRIAMADATQSRLLPNPVLNVVLRWGAGRPQVEASFTQDFVEALQIPRRASAADNRLREAVAEAVIVAIDVAAELQERYAAAQSAGAVVPLLIERLGLLDQLTAVARARLEAGEGTRIDLATLEAQRIQMEVEMDRALLGRRESRLRLARLIGEPSSEAAWELDEWAAAEIEPESESRWIDAALAHRPEVRAIVWRLRALGDDEALARLLPWEGASIGVDAERDDRWFAGPSISTPIPVFDFGQGRRARILAERMEARHDLTRARRRVVEEVRVSYQSMLTGAENLGRIRRELIPLLEERRGLAEDAYRAGESDVTALILAEQDLRAAQAQAIEVGEQAAVSFVRLQRAVGGPGVAASPGSPPISFALPTSRVTSSVPLP